MSNKVKIKGGTNPGREACRKLDLEMWKLGQPRRVAIRWTAHNTKKENR